MIRQQPMSGICSHWVRGTVIGLLAGVLAGCSADRASNANQHVERVKVLGGWVRWVAPKSLRADRMVYHRRMPTDQDAPYLTVWDTIEKPELVAIRDSGQSLFGTYWMIEFVDQDGKAVGAGQVHTGYDEVPYCLLEVKTDNPDLPPTYRGRWIPAIGFLGLIPLAQFDVSQPFRFYIGDVDEEPGANYLDVEPVEFDADIPEIKSGVGILGRAPCRCRAGEKMLMHVMPESELLRRIVPTAPTTQPRG